VDATAYFQINTGNPIVAFDPGDYLAYDRTANLYAFNIGGTACLSINAGGVSTNLPLAAPTISVDATFFQTLVSGSPRVQFDTNDNLAYDRTANTYTFNIGGTAALGIASGAVVLGTGVVLNAASPAFTGTATFGDANYGLVLTASATKPHLVFDSGNDYLEYDRGSNLFNFVIGGSTAFSVGGAGGISVPSVTTTGASGLLCAPDTGANKGGITMAPAASAGQTGRLVLLDGTGSQHSAIGPCANAGPMGFISNNGAGFYFSGGPMQIMSGLHVYNGAIPVYADNTAATAGGLVAGDVYRTATGQLMVRY
jgi:hypothetical protein